MVRAEWTAESPEQGQEGSAGWGSPEDHAVKLFPETPVLWAGHPQFCWPSGMANVM